MRITFFTSIIVSLLCAAVMVHAQTLYVASEQLTVDSTSGGVGFTASKITPVGTNVTQATKAVCRLETAEIRFSISLNDQTVTSSVGTLLEVNDTIVIMGHDNLVRFRAIRTTGSSGVLDCTYTNP